MLQYKIIPLSYVNPVDKQITENNLKNILL